jgi:anthranilate synthase component 2
MPRLLLIDNYDSFTFNVFHALGAHGAQIEVYRNDKISVADIAAKNVDAIVISPGPCAPQQAGITCAVIQSLSETTPILGICLGMQAMGEVFGGRVVRAPQPMHGKVSPVLHKGRSVFRGLNAPLKATRYHSLIVERATLPADLRVTAESEDGIIMGLEHHQRPLHGVQFHPESIASEQGGQMFKNFLDIARDWNAAQRIGQ